MFGKYNNQHNIASSAPLLNFRTKEFKCMFSLLDDAEKYDRNEEFDVSDKILTALQEYIEAYKLIKPNTVNK